MFAIHEYTSGELNMCHFRIHYEHLTEKVRLSIEFFLKNIKVITDH